MKKLNVAVAQHHYSQSYADNLDKNREQIISAAKQGADLVLLPELSLSHYFCITENPVHFDNAETIPGKSTEVFQQLARENNIVIVTTLFEKRSEGIYHNTAIVCDKDGSLAGKYRKMHIPDDPGFHEKFYFTPGDQGFKPVSTSIGKLGVLVCWDQWFPEAARMMAMADADLLLFPSAIGWEPDEDATENQRQREAWITIQRSHAIANSLPIMVSNRIGLEATDDANMQTLFWGSGFIAGQQGEILQQCTSDKAEVIMTEISLDRTKQLRRIWPYFRDRRIDAYQGLLKRHIDE